MHNYPKNPYMQQQQGQQQQQQYGYSNPYMSHFTPYSASGGYYGQSLHGAPPPAPTMPTRTEEEEKIHAMIVYVKADAIAMVSHFQSWNIKTVDDRKLAESHQGKTAKKTGETFQEAIERLSSAYFPVVSVRCSHTSGDLNNVTAIAVILSEGISEEQAKQMLIAHSPRVQKQRTDMQAAAMQAAPPPPSNPYDNFTPQDVLQGFQMQQEAALAQSEARLNEIEREYTLRSRLDRVDIQRQKEQNKMYFREKEFEAEQAAIRRKQKREDKALHVGGIILGGVLDKFLPKTGIGSALSGYLSGEDDDDDEGDEYEAYEAEQMPQQHHQQTHANTNSEQMQQHQQTQTKPRAKASFSV